MKEKQPISILPVPFDWGASRRGAASGPQALLGAGLERRLQLLGHQTKIRPDSYLPDFTSDCRTSPRMKQWGSVLAMCEAVSREIALLASGGTFPLAIGGDHSISIGTIAGLAQQKRKLGVIWIDAHADVNTPESSPSGNIHGMALAAGLGLGDPRFTTIGSAAPKLQAERIALVGTRQLDEGEKRLIRKLGVACFTMHDIDKFGMARIMEQAIAVVSSGSDGVHVSFDIDSVDPGEAPGTGTPVRGGLNFREAHLAMELLYEAGVVTSADIVEVNPLLDNGHQTVRLAVELIGSLLGARIL
ncbi:arginase [Paenibacillus oenotherae]|uniref:Arginase n=1 Tax=Paenibacillus oenotherae TaxID=1435645 RepID=A0ABS7D0J3_9BACL|nr:arginase [Paenibacillus oenotherae]MBW7473349.1 arginase [Paenibacillus oenotherae]